MKKCIKNKQNGMKKLYNTLFKVYPIVFKQVWKENLLLAFVDIFHGASFAVTIIVTQIFFDAITQFLDGKGNEYTVIRLSIILIGCQLMSQILNGFTNFYEEVVKEKCYGKISCIIQKKITKIAPIEFEKNEFLDNINKAELGAQSSCDLVNTVNSIFTFYIPYFGIMAIYMLRLNYILIISVLLVFVPVLITNYVRLYFGDVIEQEIAPFRREAETYERTLITLDCYKETRVLGATRFFINLYKKSINELNKVTWSRRKKEAIINIVLSTFSFIMYGIILVMLVYLCVKGEISVGAFAAVFSSIDVMFIIMDEVFQRCLGDIAKNVGPINNFLYLVNYPQNINDCITIKSNDISLKHITFRYPDYDKKILDDISLDIKENETVAIVGENGAGKTTLARVLIGIYTPEKGEVIMGGQKINDKKNIFKHVSAVFQKFNRYKLNINENITISDLENEENYLFALEKVDKNMNIEKDVILSRDFDGIDLSGGQWQKIAIARGIHKEASILLLDEPTSAIDPIQESELYDNFVEMSKDKTSIIITHRLGITRMVDRIIVMKDGKVVESGTQQELLDKKGDYYNMWTSQAKWYQNTNDE